MNGHPEVKPEVVVTGWDLYRNLLATVQRRQGTKAMEQGAKRAAASRADMAETVRAMARMGNPVALGQAWTDYLRDAGERTVLTMDVLRQRADRTRAHNAAGAPPVLIYDYEIIMEGRTLERPSNYMLLRIIPPKGVEVFEWKRPYVIIDPRAGHGAGIGGFKRDSQVGVALADGHPVYFVAFHQWPEPGQTIADVTHTEAAFLREIRRRHPDSPRPIVVGNCQGGWATAILAAMYPELTGPVVLSGAPMSYWGGKLGQDPMRYGGGLNGGVVPALISADLNGGIFDGAYLVQNFESLNPGRTWFGKYADLFADPEGGAERFLDFERWWGGFYLMTKAEIRWIVENLFIGNKLAKNEAFLEPGRLIDLKRITAPVIVFASHGDNITPPAQALNWIIDSYADETEIEVRGQRIIYLLHEDVGHLGIFVSSSVAKREHSQMASTLKTIEALPPGLYEMQIEDQTGDGLDANFTVSFAARTMEELQSQTGERRDEAAFAGVARASEMAAEIYETTLGPVLQAMVPDQAGRDAIEAHPMRQSRLAMSSDAPGMAAIASSADLVRADRHKLDADNPFLAMEKAWTHAIANSWDMLRDMREIATESRFFGLWAHPYAQWYGRPFTHRRTRKSPETLRALPEVTGALSRIEVGGLAEATIRALILLAGTRDDVRSDRLGRSSEVLGSWPPYNRISAERRSAIIHEQGLICRYEPDAALSALRHLVHDDAQAQKLSEAVRYVLGDVADMEPETSAMLARIEELCGLPAKNATAPAAKKQAPKTRASAAKTAAAPTKTAPKAEAKPAAPKRRTNSAAKPRATRAKTAPVAPADPSIASPAKETAPTAKKAAAKPRANAAATTAAATKTAPEAEAKPAAPKRRASSAKAKSTTAKADSPAAPRSRTKSDASKPATRRRRAAPTKTPD